MQQTGSNQAAQLAEALKYIKSDITPQDRKAAIQKFSLSRATISEYLNGRVRDNDTAVNLLRHFKECIAERSKVLAGE